MGIVLIVNSFTCLTTARVLKRVERARLSNRSAVRVATTSSSGWLKRLLKAFIVVFVALNAIALMGSYYMTHVVEPGSIGIGLPKPQNTTTPGDRGLTYSTERIELGNSAWLETWKIPSQQPTPSRHGPAVSRQSRYQERPTDWSGPKFFSPRLRFVVGGFSRLWGIER